MNLQRSEVLLPSSGACSLLKPSFGGKGHFFDESRGVRG